MTQFQFQGRRADGQLEQGRIEASDTSAAADLLRRRGITPTAIETRAEAINWQQQWQRLQDSLLGRVKLPDLIIFVRQMHALTKAGIPMLRAIRGLAENSNNRALKQALLDCVEQLERGRSLSAAMGSHPRVFPRLAVAVVHVGENTGQLETSFAQLASYFENEQDTRKRIKAAMRYPLFVLTALAVAVVVLNIFVIPTFANMFQRFDVELPWATQALIGVSEFFVAWWWALGLAILAAIVLLKRYLATPVGRSLWDGIKLRLPIIGALLNRAMLGRFSRSFAVMLRAGVPLTQALSLVAEAVDNQWMGSRIIDMRRQIERGENLTRVTTSSGLFTPLVLQMIAVGEETGRVDDLLEEVAEFYEREVDYDLKSLAARIEPVLITAVAGLVLLMALAIFTPMWDMMNAYRGVN